MKLLLFSHGSHTLLCFGQCNTGSVTITFKKLAEWTYSSKQVHHLALSTLIRSLRESQQPHLNTVPQR